MGNILLLDCTGEGVWVCRPVRVLAVWRLSSFKYLQAEITLDRSWCNRVNLYVLRLNISIERIRFEDREEESHVCNSSDRR